MVVPYNLLQRVQLDSLPASAPEKVTNPIAKQFWRSKIPINMRNTARQLKEAMGAGQYKVEPILQLDPRVMPEEVDLAFIVETSPAALRDPARHVQALFVDRTIRTRISQEPLTVAVAVSESQSEKPRLIVFGDTDFITNPDVARSPRDQNFALVLSGLEWMAEREGFVGPLPRETNFYTLPGTGSEISRIVHVPGWLMLLTLLGLGTSIWLVRRR
jgi:hypothetical protein